MIKCEDCAFGFLKTVIGGPCTRLDDEKCPNFNEETGEIKTEGEND